MFEMKLDEQGNVVGKGELLLQGVPKDFLDKVEEKAKKRFADLQKHKTVEEDIQLDVAIPSAPYQLEGVAVANVSAVKRSPQQREFIDSRKTDSSNLFFLEVRVQWRNVADEFDVHLLLPSGVHVFYGNPLQDGFKMFTGRGWQSIVGTSNEFGAYQAWYVSKEKDARPSVAIIELRAIRSFNLNGLPFTAGPTKYLTLINGKDEHRPAFVTKMDVDRDD
ncbi:MAG: hypothetical protein Q8K86_07335 [Candidatus Nanopelagicaceae bacterium]|nr:hypothetical protein [Candidatus Nanopelagicaceae bacterium]